MVPIIQLAKSGLKTSRLAFGTSRLHYLRGNERQRLLAAAAEVGFVHFDTAPAYGDGLAERELGQFLKGRRSGLVVATKYGIPPNPLSDALPALRMPILGARGIARRLGLIHRKHPPMTAAGLRLSVERSLRRLEVDTIDILFLHEPRIQNLPYPEEVAAEALYLRQRGMVKQFGLAGAWSGIADLKWSADVFRVIQTNEAEWPDQYPPDISYGAIANSPQQLFSGTRITTNEAIEKLNVAMRRRPQGAIIVSTTKTEHLHALAAASADSSPAA